MTTPRNSLMPLGIQSLPASLGPLISYETNHVTGSDGQFDGVAVTGCTIRPGATHEDVRAALAALGEQCRPCGTDFAIQQLTFLRARTKSRPDMDPTITAAAYGDWLADYPKDVAERACEEWARGMSFWPAWADLQRICDRLVSERLALRRALQRALEPAPKALYLGKPKPETRVERLRATINAYLRHSMPHKAAGVERTLASEEGREPEEWARTLPAEPAAQPIDRPEPAPFVPSKSGTSLRCAELAREWRKARAPSEAA